MLLILFILGSPPVFPLFLISHAILYTILSVASGSAMSTPIGAPGVVDPGWEMGRRGVANRADFEYSYA
ncbi:hypothetical protein [Mesorhizobium sp. WSM1497]|uniref:hypothetical protein n=1 Tax=Mesorhizobium sp. WSM1497 TaxID=278153 RepID=UPI0018DF29D2|nr:hypothetical protein [Mesorhizobium sp. WSM1497]